MSSNPLAGWELVAQAAELAQRGEDCALATVVWRQGPSSGQQGSRALVTAAGEIKGWIGGACAEPVVIREAQRAIVDGEPRLLLLGTPEQFGHVPDGMTVIPIVVPERRRDGGVHRARRVDASSRRRGSLADDAHLVRPRSGARVAHRPRRRR